VGQLRDPHCSPPLTGCTIAQLVHRYNSCWPHRCHLDASGLDPASEECALLEKVAKEMASKYPSAPTQEQRCSFVSLAGMNDASIQKDVINGISAHIKVATAVSGLERRYWARPLCKAL
jgi:hypothetical protein